MENNLNIIDWVSCQRGWFDVALFIMLMMWIGNYMVKFLLIVPSQEWHLSKELVSVVYVAPVVIYSHLKTVSSF